MVLRVKDRKTTKISKKVYISSIKIISKALLPFTIKERKEYVNLIKTKPMWELVYPGQLCPEDVETFRQRKVAFLEFLVKTERLDTAEIQEILKIYDEAPKEQVVLRDPTSKFLILGKFHSVVGMMIAISNERSNIRNAEAELRRKYPNDADKRLYVSDLVFKEGRMFDDCGKPRFEKRRTAFDVLKYPKVTDDKGRFDEALFIRDRLLVLGLYEPALKDEITRVKNGEAFVIKTSRLDEY